MLITQKQVRSEFWAEHPQFTRLGNAPQNNYCTNIRVTFVDFVDRLHRDGRISDSIAKRVML
jgi:hypothetical protein